MLAGGQEGDGRVDERWFAVALLAGGWDVLDEGVDAALDASHSAEAHLVAHGVGEALHGHVADDAVAVAVQEGVEVAEGEGAVAAEDGPAGAAEAAAPEGCGVGDRGWDGLLVGVGWAADPERRGGRPELVGEVVELGEDLDAAGGAGGELVVDAVELVEQSVSAGVEPDSVGPEHGWHGALAEAAIEAGIRGSGGCAVPRGLGGVHPGFGDGAGGGAAIWRGRGLVHGGSSVGGEGTGGAVARAWRTGAIRWGKCGEGV